MTKRFCKYEPSLALFDGSIHTETVVKDLKSELGDEAEVPVEGFSGIRVECGDTECIFEFVTYKYNGEKRKEVVFKPPPSNEVPTQAPTNIVRSQSMPPLSAPQQLAEAFGQFFQNLSSVMGQQGSPTPVFARSNTFPAQLGSSYAAPQPQPPHGIIPNNDTALLENRQQHGRSNGGGNRLLQAGRGRGLLRESAVNQSHDQGSRGSVTDPRETGRSRRRSSSTSGIMSSMSQFDSVSEEDEENLLPQVLSPTSH
ncbi:hypothetical protein GBAR_LOCUS29945 [Geodia barretti]|uniref:Uncharacterized protein n=1 Tax=Geodia barretti TaxID=519541 RepID=A0AA35TXL5_GEOBA|nr:hypothetical protein GBAR_LOCUS29945 [Geodia barretti]